MQRKILKELIKWKNKADRLPLVVTGARQVGKTYILKEFGQNNYENVVYLSFDAKNSDFSTLLANTTNPKEIISFLSLQSNTTILPEKTLIIFDEIQEEPSAFTLLKYFAEDAPEYHIAVAGSLLGVALHSGTSFPVGKVTYLNLDPLDFEEFLWALGKENITNHLKNNIDKANDFNVELKNDLYQYLAIGGMPKAVKKWVDDKDIEAVEKILEDILLDYQNDFSKHTDNATAEKIRYIWQSIPAQFAKENHKFIYGIAKDGARARELEFAIQWLVDAGLVRKVNVTSSGDKLPLIAYQDQKIFKLYLLDVGLLRKLAKLDPSVVINDESVFNQFGGAFAEQYVLQQIQKNDFRDNIYYWTGSIGDSDDQLERKSKSEVDFTTAFKMHIVPIEVKSGTNVYAKSLHVYRNKYNPKLAIRFSLLPREYNNQLLNMPLYESFLFEDFLKKYLG